MTLVVSLFSCSRIKHFHMWGTCQCEEHRFLNMYSRLKQCPHDAVTKIFCIHFQGALFSLKTRKLHLHSSEPFNWDHRSTDMHAVVMDIICCQYFFIFFKFIITYFLQGKEEDSDVMIRMERSSPLFSEEVVLDQRTGMIGTVRAAHDEEVQVILRSIYEKCSKPFCWR